MVGELSQEFLRSQRAAKLAEKMCQCYDLCHCIGMMLASFHMCGMVLVLRVRLKVLVRYVRPNGPMCLRCLMLMPSGPVELLFLLFRMAADISDVVSINVVLGSL